MTEVTEHTRAHTRCSSPFAHVLQAEAPMCLRTFALALPAGWCHLCPVDFGFVIWKMTKFLSLNELLFSALTEA